MRRLDSAIITTLLQARRPPNASVALKVTFDIIFDTSNLNYPGIYMHIAWNSHFGDLRGHSGLQTASVALEVKFDIRFDKSNLNYPGIYVYIAWNSHFGGLWGHSSLHMTSEVTSDLRFEFSGLNNPCSSASLASIVLCLINLDGKKGQISSIDLLASPQVKRSGEDKVAWAQNCSVT